MLKGFIKRCVPPRIYYRLRSVPYWLMDILVSPPNGHLIPPLRLQTDGPRGYEVFRQNGDEALRFYQSEMALPANAKILDMGCGVGRKTIPLTQYLSDEGLYVGFDIVQAQVDWCSRNITPRFKQFLFYKIDVYNYFYNPWGKLRPTDLRLPFPDGCFDVVCLWSVFTHMYPSDGLHYLKECARVLKPGGKIVASYYLMNEASKDAIARGRAAWAITHLMPERDCWTNNPNIPEDLISWGESYVESAYAAVGLRLPRSIMFGGWVGARTGIEYPNLNFQDIIIAQKI
jgi:SAM-dependent methyltransferase